MYGSSLMLVTRMPRDSRIAARDAAAMPLPREETTPPVTKTYLVIYFGRVGMEESTGVRPTLQIGELLAAAEMLQRLGVGERFQVLHRPAVHHLAHRQLDDLAALGARDVRNLQRLSRIVARGGLSTDSPLDALNQGVVELLAFLELHEEHPADVGLPVLTDYQRLHHLLDLLDLAVDPGGADAHAARVEHRVG